MQFLKTTHLFVSLCRSSILNLLYLCNFRSSRSEILACDSPLSPISNLIDLIEILFCKKELYPISHDDLSISWLSRANLYEVPHVTVSTFKPENDTQKKTNPFYFCPCLQNLNPMLTEKVMMIFLRSPIWHGIREPKKTLTSLDHISENVVNQDVKFSQNIDQGFFSNGF